MKILVTLPHFYNSQIESKHGSQGKDPRPRIMALSMALMALQGLYGESQCMINIGKCTTLPVNQAPENQLDIIICTTGNYHLLAHLPIPASLYSHHPTDAEPIMLGFECQAVLRDQLGNYDYYCYLEDDLIAHDPWLLTKLGWFNSHAGFRCLLQPNRYEVSPQGIVVKAYVDGDLYPHLTANFQNVQDQPQFVGKVMDQPVKFQRALNPHSGCYFLNAEQMEYWANQSYFLDRDCSFIGPLESAATLGIMKTFKIYKPVAEYANFLEIQHFGSSFLNLIGKQVKVNHLANKSSEPEG
ncbi:MAG: calcium-binding protein [Oscillatoriales cyanobacterium RM2_1_1]|nr:calcium-binding protein [Oscillatoriales cyanobacterium SM2_3_0]NJO46125.1 calcium-binding protein [Oscillatoriales cyanobacterium RM2_1_1]